MGPTTADSVNNIGKYAAGVNAAKEAIASTSSQLAALKPAMEAATNATKNHGAATEAMVLVHEAMSGRFSRMGGSLMILTQRLGGASLAMMAMGGAAGVAAMGLMHLIEWMDKVSAAKLAAEAGGVGSGIAVKDLDAQVDKLRKVTTEAEQAGAAVHTMASLPGMNLPVMDQLSTDLHALSLRMGEDIPSAAKKVGEAWNLNAVAGAELLNKTRATTAAVQAFVKASQEGDALKARSVLLRVAARITAEEAASTGAQAPAAAAAVAEVERQAAVAAAGAFAATAAIPIIGPELAPGAGAAALAAVQAMAPMASFAVGAWELPHDMIAQVHAGEMIIPAGPAAAIRAGGNGSGTVATGGGGGDVHLHVHAVDAGSVTALFRSQGADLARIVSQQLSNNPSLRPRY